MKSRYLVDVRVSSLITGIPVEIDEDSPGTFRTQLVAAANKVVDGRLTLLDLKGSRSGSDGLVEVSSVTGLVNWNQQ
jgi:hypothetical protein